MTLTNVFAGGLEVDIWNVADVDPVGTVTDAGHCKTDVFNDVNVTIAPPVGAASSIVKDPVPA